MYKKNMGFANEYDFVVLLNGKKVKELDPISREMIEKLYSNISEDDVIKCWRNKLLQKGDIILSVRNCIKSISIKMGEKNSVHAERLHNFIIFLRNSNIPSIIIKLYLEYHYADGTRCGRGKKRLSVYEYKKKNQSKIDLINKYFSNEKFVLKCVERFILKGNNSKFEIQGLIYGVPNDYFFLTKDEIVSILLKNKDKYSTGVHVSLLSVQPKARDLNYTGKYEKDRHVVQIKWFNILSDLIKYYMM